MMAGSNVILQQVTLVRRYVGRLVDVSSTGCLIEIAAPLTLGSVGRLEAEIDGQVYAEAVRVVRIDAFPESGAVQQIALEFLLVSPASVTSIRAAVHRLTTGADAIVKFIH